LDSNQFDTLVKSLSSTDTRRELLRRLAPLPLAGLLATLLPDESAAGGRRKRRRTRNVRQSGDDKDNRTGKRTGKGTGKRTGKGKDQEKRRKECVPNSLPQTCAGKCATVIDNCGAPVE